MQSITEAELVGYLDLQVGSMAVKVPVRSASALREETSKAALPLASFEIEGNSYAIVVRGDTSSKAVEKAMRKAAEAAMRHLSRKLLN